MRLRTAGIALVFACHPVFSTVAQGADLYFPPVDGPWKTVAPSAAGFDGAGLDAAGAYAESEHSSALLILDRGRIVYEKHWPIAADSSHSSGAYQRMLQGQSDDGQSIEDVASVQKSVVSFLAGIAVTQGKLSLDERVSAYLKPGWSKATTQQEDAITVRHLMTMTSGLTDALTYKEPAGTAWRYNTGAYSQMCKVLEAVFGKDLNALTSELLTDRIGMADSRWTPRPTRRTEASNSIGFTTSARDLARFGIMILAGGRWDGEELGVSPQYLKAMLSSSQKLNPAYGLLWWLNGQAYSLAPGTRGRRDGSLLRTAPSDLVAARGALGRSVSVSPSTGLIVVRTGNQPSRTFDVELWRLIMKAKAN
jgi:CubicO group peptidase (beta-lactamase class C family)